MSKPYDFGSVNLNAGGDSTGARPTSETPFCIAILGDFSGRINRRLSEPQSIGQRSALLVDRDNFDEVLSRLHPEIRLPLGDNGALRLAFSDLDDFHPDRIFERLEAFSTLRALRSRLQDPSTFREAAEELGLRSSASPERSVPRPGESLSARAPSAVGLASGSLLDEMIEQTESRTSQPARRAPDPVREFAQRVGAQHLVNAPDPRQPEILAVMDRAIGALMRAILHNPDFQALEAIWRATFLLVRELETGSQLKLYLIDVSKEELLADLSSADLRGSGTYRLLVEKTVGTPGADPWAIILGDFHFGAGEQDVALLSRMAEIARSAKAPFLTHAGPEVIGCSSLESASHPRDWNQPPQSWSRLRHIPDAKFLGLALPRFLLRLPYGKKTCALESFDLEELTDSAAHEDYLWANPAFALGLLLAESFSESGWELRPGSAAEMRGLPLHFNRKNGDSEAKPCAEVLLTEEAVERILDLGLIPLVSFKNRDSVRVARFQSIAQPSAPLSGRWWLSGD